MTVPPVLPSVPALPGALPTGAGATDISAAFPTLVHLIEGGDFERQSTWYLGLSGEACVRVLLLDAPPRLVIDVEH